MTITFQSAIGLLAVAVAFLPAGVEAGSNDVPNADSPSPIVRTALTSRTRGDSEGVQRLIDQLGSDQYFLRRNAEEKLIERGADVFDHLQQAEENPDLEIATRAHYILQRIRIEWIDPNDPAEVQAAMLDYGELNKVERLERMDQLIALPHAGGWGALCRIARYEPSPQLARYASLKVMKSTEKSDEVSDVVAVFKRELGDSQRAPADWLRTYVQQLQQPKQLLDRWLTLIDEETARLAQDSPDTEAAFIYELIDFHLDLCRETPRPEAIFASLQSRTDLYVNQDNRLRDGLAYAMNWLWENEQWEALELLEDHYEETIRQERLLVYLSAAARWKQGRDELAEDFAERAYKLDADDDLERADVGDLIGEMGRHDWAEREWSFVVEKFPVLDANSMSARRSLALLRLHDRGDDEKAAAIIGEVIDAVQEDPKLKRNLMRDAGGRYLLNQLYAQKNFFLACQAAAEGKYDEHRKFLELAAARDPQDPDVLIAMYRAEGADDEFRSKTVKHIRESARIVEGYIEQQPDNAQWYNHWAWLVSNTEGDYAQAVKYSLRSLELSPDNPSYLDTLGRCYYAVGDLENAVRVEREAVQRHPHLQVMRNQLDLFESSLAERQNKNE